MHIVVFTGGQAPEPFLTQNYFLKGNNSFAPDAVIAADSGLETLQRYAEYFTGKIDFTPNYICGDMDSISDKKLIEKYPYAEKQLFPEYKDYTDTELALKKACMLRESHKEEGFENTITLVGGDGGRTDHLLGILETFSSEEKADFWLCCKQTVCFVKDGTKLEISGLTQNDCVSVYKVNEKQNAGFITKGLEWNSEVFRKTRMPSLSNRICSEWLSKKLPVEIIPQNTDCLIFIPYTADTSKSLLKEN